MLTFIEYAMNHIDATGNGTGPELTPVDETIIIATTPARVDELQKKNNSTSPFQERSTQVLLEITDHLRNLKDKQSSPLFEV